MNADFPIVIDACVLVQAAIRDTLLRLSEKRLFLCRWSDDIIEETARTLQTKLGLDKNDCDYLIGELKEHFPDAWVEQGYKQLISAMPVNEKDRHVVAAAVRSGSEVILTYNLKHFPADSLTALDICARHPDAFLIDLYHLNPEIVVHTLHEQGAALNTKRSLPEILKSLEVCQCPKFAQLVTQKLSL
jgi:hypothetical protein